MKRLTLITTLLLSVFITTEVVSQVTIAPTNLFVSNTSRFGTYMVINGSNEAQEISIEFFFAYSMTDANGSRSIVSDDDAMEGIYSIADNVKAFPQNFVLQPGQRQIVRLRIAGVDNGLEDGTYWARIKTTSSPQSPPIEIGTTGNEVSARVGIRIEQVTGLFYKIGDTSTGIEIQDIRPVLSEDNVLSVLTDYKRTGNSPFLGSITTSLLDNNNQEVRRAYISTSLYFDGTHAQTLDLNDLPQGNYTIRVRFESERSDVSSRDIVQMDPALFSKSYTIK